MKGVTGLHNNNIRYFEKESQKFDPLKHFTMHIQEMNQHSEYGAEIAKEWSKVISEIVSKDAYPVIHPIGEETFSLFKEYPTGVYEYAFSIDKATSLINKENIDSISFSPADIIKAIEIQNINTDLKLKRPNHKNPVMVVQSKYLTGNKLYAINGNHRIFEAFRNEVKSIDVYVFEDLEFLPFFYDYLSKVSYCFEIDYLNVMSDKSFFLENPQDAVVYKL